MAADESFKTSAFWCRLDDDFAMMQEYLERVGFSDATANEFRIFCNPEAAVEFFGMPKTTHHNGMKVVMVSDFPSFVAGVVRSTEFAEVSE